MRPAAAAAAPPATPAAAAEPPPPPAAEKTPDAPRGWFGALTDATPPKPAPRRDRRESFVLRDAPRRGGAPKPRRPKKLDASSEVDAVKALVRAYFSVVRKTFCDLVPKIVMTHVVGKVEATLQTTLMADVYAAGDHESLLAEDGDADTACPVCLSDHPALVLPLTLAGEPWSLCELHERAWQALAHSAPAAYLRGVAVPERRAVLGARAAEELPSASLDAKMRKWMALRARGVRVNDALRQSKGFRNPDFLQSAVARFGVDERATMFSPDVFDPNEIAGRKEDDYQNLAAAQKRAAERREKERKAAGPNRVVQFRSAAAERAAAAAAAAAAEVTRRKRGRGA